MADKTFKIVLVGASNVGKTLLTYKFCQKSDPPTATVGVDIYKQTIYLSNDNEQSLRIWDTSGRSTYLQMHSHYLKDSNIVMICIDKNADWSEVKEYYQNILSFVRFNSNNAKIMLVVTKAENDEPFDAILKLREAIKSDSELNERCEDEIYYTNAETGRNVQELFRRAAIIANEADLRKSSSVEQHLDLTKFLPLDVHTAKKPSLFFNMPTLVGTTTGILAGLTIDGALLGALFFTTTLIVTMPYVAAVVCAAILLGTLLVGMSAGIGYAAYDNHKTPKPHMA